jgi:hypothetical protein
MKKKKQVPVLVQVSDQHIPDVYVVDRNNLGPFIKGYLKRAIKASGLKGFTIDDIDDPSIVLAARTCLRFYWDNRFDMEIVLTKEYDTYKAGSDFWLSRNRKKGYKGRGSDDAFLRLHESAKAFGKAEIEADGNELTLRPNEKIRGVLL